MVVPRRAASWEDSICGTSWDITIQKASIYPDKLRIVQLRLDTLRHVSSLLVPFTEVRLSPMYMHITAHSDALKTLGPRDQYVPLVGGMPETEARRVLAAALQCLVELHGQRLVHGHLGTHSFLRESRAGGPVVMIDHALPIPLLVSHSVLGRTAYRLAPPEILRREPFGYAADTWGIGALLLQLLLPAGTVLETADIVDTDLLSPFLLSLSPSVRSLLIQCLKNDTSCRPLLSDLLVHPFFKEPVHFSPTSGHEGAEQSSESTDSETDEEESLEDDDSSDEEEEEEEEEDSNIIDAT